MTVSPDMAERHARQLARFAELALTLAEDMHAAAAAAAEPDQKARLAEAFHRAGRALRQSIALEARLVRDRARDLKAAEADAAAATAAAVRRRQDQVRAGVERQIYCEIEPHEADAWLADFDERLEAETLYDGFTDESVADQIARLSAELGLTGEVKHDYLPRSCRPRRPPGGYARMFPGFFADADEDDDDPLEGDFGDDEAEVAPQANAPANASPIRRAPPEEAATPLDHPPEGEAEPPPERPREPPPDPERYIPPWDRVLPDGHFPGGSGY